MTGPNHSIANALFILDKARDHLLELNCEIVNNATLLSDDDLPRIIADKGEDWTIDAQRSLRCDIRDQIALALSALAAAKACVEDIEAARNGGAK